MGFEKEWLDEWLEEFYKEKEKYVNINRELIKKQNIENWMDEISVFDSEKTPFLKIKILKDILKTSPHLKIKYAGEKQIISLKDVWTILNSSDKSLIHTLYDAYLKNLVEFSEEWEEKEKLLFLQKKFDELYNYLLEKKQTAAYKLQKELDFSAIYELEHPTLLTDLTKIYIRES